MGSRLELNWGTSIFWGRSNFWRGQVKFLGANVWGAGQIFEGAHEWGADQIFGGKGMITYIYTKSYLKSREKLAVL